MSTVQHRTPRALPQIIQGGMGIAVSSWRLARRVAQLGEFGVVSGTAIDAVVVRELQQGDPVGRRRALRAYPDQEIAEYLIAQFYVEGGLPKGTPYKLLPIHGFKPSVRDQRILAAAAFTEVFLAKEGHDGLIGINLLAKIKRHTLACLYGAMLAGVDAVLMGAGIPVEEALALQQMAAGQPARLRLDVDTSMKPDAGTDFFYTLNPADLLPEPPVLQPPMFFPIISSDSLARILAKKLPEGCVTGWIIEGPTAGGHNAPPRNKQQDEHQNPVYDDRDRPNLDNVKALGLPFYLAGGYGTPERFQEALALGAAGIQVGSLFSLADESGYPEAHKRRLIAAIHRGEVTVRTDGRTSSTGFPFKVVEFQDTLGQPDLYLTRKRICDLGYLQSPYLDKRGRLQGRCAAEPVDTYVRKGGRIEDTERRACLCNGLMANIGLGQQQKWGPELPLFTAGDDLVKLPLGSAEEPHYSAEDVIRYLRGASIAGVQSEASCGMASLK